MTAVAGLPLLLASGVPDWIGLVVFLLFLLGGAVKSAAQKAKERARAVGGDEGTSSAASPPPETVAGALGDEIAAAVRHLTRPPSPPTTRPSTAARPTPPARPRPVRVRRKGLVDDAHVDLSSRLPTSDDMPGAHAAHEPGHGHLAQIGGDRGTVSAHPGAQPSAAARAPHERDRLSPKELLTSGRLVGKDRLRAGLLWVEVLGPPRSRRRRS